MKIDAPTKIETQSLRELIECASCGIEKLFTITGQVLPMWHAFTADGENFVKTAEGIDKDTDVMLIRALFEITNVVRYVFVSEAWILDRRTRSGIEGAELANIKEHGISEHPDRVEVVMFHAEDANGLMSAHRKIIRPKRGKATLGQLAVDDMTGHISEGRLVGLLPAHKGTKQ